VPPATAQRGARSGQGAGAFRGWPVAAVEFFDRLAVDNTKTFWTANKAVYETKVRAPMQALLDELAPRCGEGRVMRPYRDIRFSKDKTPYKTNIAGHNDAVYVSLNANGLGVGSGLYQPSPGQLARFRAAVDADASGTALVSILEALRKKKIGISAHEVLKTAPRGYAKDHPRLGLLQHKGITAWQEWPVGAWLGTADAKKRIVAFIEASQPLRDWIDRYVGPDRG
jgi:uncharacterized protein (TIGR02453 family)